MSVFCRCAALYDSDSSKSSVSLSLYSFIDFLYDDCNFLRFLAEKFKTLPLRREYLTLSILGGHKGIGLLCVLTLPARFII